MLHRDAHAYIISAFLVSILLAVCVERAMHTWPATIAAHEAV